MKLARGSLLFVGFALLGGCASAVSVGTSGDARVADGALSGDARVVGPDVTVVTPDDVPAPPLDDMAAPPPDAVFPVGPDAGPPRIDSGFPVGPDGAVMYPPDAGYDPGVRCGTMVCSSAQECCPDRMTRALTCVARGACMTPSATCDGPEDCPSSQRCCLGGVMGMRFDMSDLACFPSAQCATIPVIGAVAPCHTNADCPSNARRCCDVSGLAIGGFMIPAGIPRICAPFCPTGG